MEVITTKSIEKIVCNDFEDKKSKDSNLARSLKAEKLQIIANSDPYLLENQDLLLSYYREIKSSWSSAIVNRIKQQHKLNLRQKLDRCILAVMAAQEKIEFTPTVANSITSKPIRETIPTIPTPSTVELELAARVEELERQLEATSEQLTQTNTQLNKQVKLNIIVATDRLLPAGPPLNGIEESPTFKVLGSPTTLTQLEHNYRVLEGKLLDKVNKYRREIKELRLHPDLSQDNDEDWSETIANYRNLKDEAIERLNLVKSLYNLHHENWDLLKPTIPISDEEKAARMNAPIKNGWTAASFWE